MVVIFLLSLAPVGRACATPVLTRPFVSQGNATARCKSQDVRVPCDMSLSPLRARKTTKRVHAMMSRHVGDVPTNASSSRVRHNNERGDPTTTNTLNVFTNALMRTQANCGAQAEPCLCLGTPLAPAKQWERIESHEAGAAAPRSLHLKCRLNAASARASRACED